MSNSVPTKDIPLNGEKIRDAPLVRLWSVNKFRNRAYPDPIRCIRITYGMSQHLFLKFISRALCCNQCCGYTRRYRIKLRQKYKN